MRYLKHTRIMLGPSPEVVEFARSFAGENLIAVGDAIELVRGPLPSGWTPSTTRILQVSDDDHPISAEATELSVPHVKKLAGLGWEAKYRVASWSAVADAPSILQLALVPTTYEAGTGFHRALAELTSTDQAAAQAFRHSVAARIIQSQICPLPGIAVVHAVISTADEYLLFSKRPPTAGYHPSAWSVSFEEQITADDVSKGGAAMVAGAARGLEEEFASSAGMCSDDARALSLFMQFGILNIGACVYAETPLTFHEIQANWQARARDRWEAVAISPEPFTLQNVARLLRLDCYSATAEESQTEFHPTSKYRILMAAACRFGLREVLTALG